jgi:E3 ubiquitin-protein ligase synoviolin
MDQRPYPGPPLLFHARMCILFVVLWSVDMVMFLIALDNTLAYGVGGMVLFASEVCHCFSTIQFDYSTSSTFPVASTES